MTSLVFSIQFREGSKVEKVFQFQNLIKRKIIFIAEYIARHGRMSEALARRKFWQMVMAVEY